MKIYRPMFAPLVSLLVAAGALAAVPLAGAASTDTAVQATVKGQVGDSAAAQTQSSSAETSLTGASTERVNFSGKALIKANVREDPDFRTPPIVVLTIDLTGISGVGATTRKKYVTTDKSIVQRRLRPTDTVELTFPFWVSGTTATGSGPVGNLSIALTYDVNTKTLTAASGTITSP